MKKELRALSFLFHRNPFQLVDLRSEWPWSRMMYCSTRRLILNWSVKLIYFLWKKIVAHWIERNLFCCDFYSFELWRVSGPSVFFCVACKKCEMQTWLKLYNVWLKVIARVKKEIRNQFGFNSLRFVFLARNPPTPSEPISCKTHRFLSIRLLCAPSMCLGVFTLGSQTKLHSIVFPLFFCWAAVVTNWGEILCSSIEKRSM